MDLRWLPCFGKTGKMGKFQAGTWQDWKMLRFLYFEGNFCTDPLMRRLDPSNLATSWIGPAQADHVKRQNAEAYLSSLRDRKSVV